MNPVAQTVPRDVVAVDHFVENFRAEHGVPPFAGGETVPQAAPAGAPQATPAPAPAVDPAQLPAGVDPANVQPQAPAPQAPEPQAAPAAPPEQEPEWMRGLIDRMDRIAPPEVDPLSVELGLVPPPVAQPQTQTQQQPASPAPQPQMPQQPGTPFPGVQPGQQQELALIQQWIAEEAQKAAQSYVDPRFEQLQQDRRQQEYEGLRQDYEEFRDPMRGNEIVSRARQWATQMGNQDLAREPMFLEMTLLAGRTMEAARQAQAQQPVPPAGAQPQVPGQQPYPIEQPGPAAPAPAVTPEKAISQRIVGAGGSRLSPLWA